VRLDGNSIGIIGVTEVSKY